MLGKLHFNFFKNYMLMRHFAFAAGSVILHVYVMVHQDIDYII